ncbi:hypothetical protein D3C76_1461310 [compost metagenome]
MVKLIGHSCVDGRPCHHGHGVFWSIYIFKRFRLDLKLRVETIVKAGDSKIPNWITVIYGQSTARCSVECHGDIPSPGLQAGDHIVPSSIDDLDPDTQLLTKLTAQVYENSRISAGLWISKDVGRC